MPIDLALIDGMFLSVKTLIADCACWFGMDQVLVSVLTLIADCAYWFGMDRMRACVHVVIDS